MLKINRRVGEAIVIDDGVSASLLTVNEIRPRSVVLTLDGEQWVCDQRSHLVVEDALEEPLLVSVQEIHRVKVIFGFQGSLLRRIYRQESRRSSVSTTSTH